MHDNTARRIGLNLFYFALLVATVFGHQVQTLLRQSGNTAVTSVAALAPVPLLADEDSPDESINLGDWHNYNGEDLNPKKVVDGVISDVATAPVPQLADQNSPDVSINEEDWHNYNGEDLRMKEVVDGVISDAAVTHVPQLADQDSLDLRYDEEDGPDTKVAEEMTLEERERLAYSAKLQLVDLDVYQYARCMDGTPAGFYWKRAATMEAKDNWILHLQGGGECDTADRCLSAKTTNLGTSNLFTQLYSFYGDAVDVQVNEDGNITAYYEVLMSSRYDLNPNFCDWNKVYIPYCSQDLWVGQRTTSDQDTWGLYFSGQHILDAIIDTLDNQGMHAAKNLIFSGDSAGAYGVFANLDRIASKHPQTKTAGLPIGGLWSYAHPYEGPGHTENRFSDFRKRNWPEMKALWHANFNEDCLEESDRNKASCMVGCSLAPFPWTHTKTPLFITESNVDMVLSIMHNWVPEPPSVDGLHAPQLYDSEVKDFLEHFGQNMTQCLRQGLETMHSNGKFNIGVFSPSCFVHTQFSKTPQINGKSFTDAFADFFFQHGDPPILIEDGFLTNPSCRSEYISIHA